MKLKQMTLIGLFGSVAALSQAEERPPICFFTNGDIDGYVGHDVRLVEKSNVERVKDGVKFNGKNSLVKFAIPWMYPNQVLSVTFVADIRIDAIPAKDGFVVLRPGFDNKLNIRGDGKVTFSIWNYTSQKEAVVESRTRIEAGGKYRLAGVVDCSRDNKTRLSLYIDGRKEGDGELDGPPRPYSQELCLGGVSRDNTIQCPLACVIYNFWYFYKPLTAEEINALPGKQE